MKFALLALLVAVAFAQHHPTGKWVRTIPTGPYFPQGRYFHAQSSVGDRAVVFGGLRGDVYFNDLFSLSIQQSTVNLLDDGTTGGPSARAGACAEYLGPVLEYVQYSDGSIETVVVRNATYVVFGGTDGTQYFNDFWYFDLGGQAWTQITFSGAPSARAFHTCVVTGTSGAENLAIFGGTDGSSYFGAESFYLFNSTDDTWTTLGNDSPNGIAPSGRAYIQGVDQGDSLYVFGGYDGTDCLGDTWVYEFDKASWFNVPTTNTPNPNAAYAGVRMLGGGYDIFGGFDSCTNTINDLEALSHNTPDWRLVPPGGVAPPPRGGSVLTRHGHDLLLYGGADGSFDSDGVLSVTQVFDDLWYYIV